ncbi:hypothetical protein [Kitasatospora purpeofusca]|uniref:hypothetical protein n=1 Tax=Kitasatospora purpeofusca TaxID=67352 RepID=UPI0036D2E0D2
MTTTGGRWRRQWWADGRVVAGWGAGYAVLGAGCALGGTPLFGAAAAGWAVAAVGLAAAVAGAALAAVGPRPALRGCCGRSAGSPGRVPSAC